MYSEQPLTFQSLVERAERCIERRSKGYVEDAIVFSRWILNEGAALIEENKQMREKLGLPERQESVTLTREQCDQLLANKALK